MTAGRKTEPPTRRRVQRARAEGDVPVSFAAVRWFSLLAGATALLIAASSLCERFSSMLSNALSSPDQLGPSSLATSVLALCAPICAVSGGAALLGGVAQTRGAFAVRRLGRRTAGGGLSAAGAPAALGALLLSLIAAAVSVQMLAHLGPAVASSVGRLEPSLELLRVGTETAVEALVGVFTVWVAADVMLARYRWRRSLRMSREEIQQEQREAEGDEAVKQARLRAHRQVLQAADAWRLQAARLLVTGHAGLAVALSFDPTTGGPPTVLLQAAGAFGAALQREAAARGIPVAPDSELARRLAALAPDDPIPPSSFEPVATLLAALPREAASAPPG